MGVPEGARVTAVKTQLTELQFTKVSTADLLAHAEVGPHHENPGRAGGTRGPRRVSAAVALGHLGAPGGPLAVFVPGLIHGASSSGHREPGVMHKKASWAGPTAATAPLTAGAWMARSRS